MSACKVIVRRWSNTLSTAPISAIWISNVIARPCANSSGEGPVRHLRLLGTTIAQLRSPGAKLPAELGPGIDVPQRDKSGGDRTRYLAVTDWTKASGVGGLVRRAGAELCR